MNSLPDAGLDELRKSAHQGGGASRIDRQHSKGKLTARERITALVDPGSFQEIGLFAGAAHNASVEDRKTNPGGGGVVTGQAVINGRLVYLFSQDFTVMGGSVGTIQGRKISRVMELAIQTGAPLIGLNDSGGARIQEGVKSLAAYGDIFYQNVQASGVVPQLSIILGPCAGGAVYSPAITDFVFMVEDTAQMFITGPDVIREVTHEEIDLESLGGAEAQSTQSGVAHFQADSEEEIFNQVRNLLSFLPSNNLSPAPRLPADDLPGSCPQLSNLVPQSSWEPYDIHLVIQELMDQGEFLEIQNNYAKNIVIGFARLGGQSVGLVANQPDHLAGVIDINASDKAARFIRFCDAFHIPILTLVDTPGFLPGVEQEHNGIIRHGAKMIYAYAEATVPKITLILRKAYGGAYIVMGSKHLSGDFNLAWLRSEIAVMGPEGAVKILHRRQLQEAVDPDQLQKKLAADYRDEMASPLLAAAEGYLDNLIKPEESRQQLILGLEMLQEKRQQTPKRKHGNIPL